MIGIIGALQKEVDGLLSMMKRRVDREYCGTVFSSGYIGGVRVVVAASSAGKVLSSMCAAVMCIKYKPSLLINTGIAGAVDQRLSLGDIVISDFAVQHDLDTSAIDGTPKGWIQSLDIVKIPADKKTAAVLAEAARANGLNFVEGTIVSGDQFIADNAKKAELFEKFGAAACEMEGAAIATVAAVNRIPFVILRAISDNADSGAVVDFPAFCRRAAANSIKVLSAALPELGQGAG